MKTDSSKLRYLGNGPSATGGGQGWALGKRFFRCVSCGDYLHPASMTDSGSCDCGKLHIDFGMHRFGSSLGDDQIEVYELIDSPVGRSTPN